jgi:hypothetical protein
MSVLWHVYRRLYQEDSISGVTEAWGHLMGRRILGSYLHICVCQVGTYLGRESFDVSFGSSYPDEDWSNDRILWN